MAVEVLVVDDDRLAAESFARLIEAETMLPTVFTDDPDEAVRIVQRHQIKVAVLDQKMPKQSGTALFKRLRENNPSLRAILFSGQADTQDLRDAIRERFMEMLDKNELRRLPSVVRKYYALHLSELVRRKYENISPLGVYRTGFSFRGTKVTFELMEMTDAGGVNRTVVLEEQFKTVIRLHAGETKRTAYTIAHEAEVILEHEEQIKATLSTQYDTKASAAAAVKLEMASQLKWALESSLRQRYQTRRLDRTEEVVEETHSLPAEVAGSGPQVSARHLQKAPVYERIRVIARTTCECCGIQQYDSYIVLVPTGEYQTRQVDYLDDNTTRTTLTG